MKKTVTTVVFTILFAVFITGCSSNEKTDSQSNEKMAHNESYPKNAADVDETTVEGTVGEIPMDTKNSYKQISQEEAKALMDGEEPVIILDVRTYEEFEQGHIENALCIPVENINENSKAQIESMFTSKEQIILVYCRSGNRSKTASQRLADMGYVNVMEFGGINDWKYGTVTD